MFIVGLTGGIGSGKTTVSDHFQALGIAVVDADRVAREIVEPGSDCLQKIHKKFGDAILLQDGSLNRSVLRTTIFENASDRVWLEQLTHPLIRDIILKRLKQARSPYAVLSAPLLLESEAYTVDRVLVVDLPETLQLKRAVTRDSASRAHIEKIIASQLSREARLKQADDIVDNSQSLEHTLAQVDQLHQYYLQLSQKT